MLVAAKGGTGVGIDGMCPSMVTRGESLSDVLQRFLPLVLTYHRFHAATSDTLVVMAYGGVLAAGPTQLFSNISPAFALRHMFGNTAAGEFIDGQLVCTDWHATVPLR